MMTIQEWLVFSQWKKHNGEELIDPYISNYQKNNLELNNNGVDIIDMSGNLYVKLPGLKETITSSYHMLNRYQQFIDL